MKRQIIEIDEEKCDGCGLCVPECHEGALQIIEGKVRLISDLFCDGLGACIGYCPQEAIKIIEREAQPYNEAMVMEKMVNQPKAVLKAHMKHLSEHKAYEFLDEALAYLKEKGIDNPMNGESKSDELQQSHAGCPGSRTIQFNAPAETKSESNKIDIPSELRQWPVQLHLVNPNAPYFKNSELVLMSTCGPIASANVHSDYIKGRSIVVACPKLDYTAPYTEKLTEIFKTADIKKVIVVIMQVPCCSGLMKFAVDANKLSGKKDMIIEQHILSLDGKLLQITNC